MRRDPFSVSVAVLTALVVAGFAAVAGAWSGVAARLVVALQSPYAVSGGVGGVALAGFALGLLAVQAARRDRARERAELDHVVVAAAGVLAALRETDRRAEPDRSAGGGLRREPPRPARAPDFQLSWPSQAMGVQ